MKAKITKILVLTLGITVCALAGAQASLIGPGAFGASAVTEGFEGIAPGGPNTGPIEGGNNFVIGTSGPYTFASGVIFTAPVQITNPSWWHGEPFISDFSISGNVSNWWGSNGYVTAAPFGNAWMGAFDLNESVPRSLEFTFSQKIDRVGAYVTGWEDKTVTLAVYGDSGLLESYSFNTVPVSQWPDNFLGIQADGITKVVFSGTDIGVDNLKFEKVAAVSLPSTLSLLAGGFIGIVLLGRRRRKNRPTKKWLS